MKIILLRVASFYKNTLSPLDHPFFAPSALGVLFSQLKNNGYDVLQEDLSIRAHRNIFDKGAPRHLCYELFFQKERIIQYAKSGSDDVLENELKMLLDSAEIKKADIFLLSVPESPYNPSNILFAFALAKFLKKTYSSQIVVGGDTVALTALKTEYDTDGIIDYIVIGQGEEAVLEIIDRIKYNKDRQKPNETIGMRGVDSNKIIIPDFSGLPLEKYRLSFLDFKYFSSCKMLRDFFASDTSMLLFQFTKGCPNRCAFCSASKSHLGPILQPEEVVSALQALQKKFNPTGYFFLNDTINISKTYIERICDLICEKELDILWTACAHVNGLDEEVIAKMRRAGCIRLILGMETASPGLLRRVNKGISIPELEKALKLLSKYGIWSGVEVICGLPHETEEDINETIDFLLNNKNDIDMVYAAVFDLREGSLMYEYPREYLIENIRELNLYREEGSRASNITNFVKFGFDEIDGLRWPDKQKQMRHSYERVQRETHTLRYPNSFLGEHLLFYLYSKFNDKNVIKQNFYEIAPYIP